MSWRTWWGCQTNRSGTFDTNKFVRGNWYEYISKQSTTFFFAKERFSSFISNYCSVICIMKPLITDNNNSDVHRLFTKLCRVLTVVAERRVAFQIYYKQPCMHAVILLASKKRPLHRCISLAGEVCDRGRATLGYIISGSRPLSCYA